MRTDVSFALGVIEALLIRSEANEDDKRELRSIQSSLLSKDMSDIIADHEKGNVTADTLDKMEKLSTEIADKVLESMHKNPMVEVFWKVMNRQRSRTARLEYESMLQCLRSSQETV